MKGYIYITGTGVDPSLRAGFTDPTFRNPPMLGPCMPNIRKAVAAGDWIFIVSGKIPEARQYIIGGLQVAEKIHAVDAYKRFPENRLRVDQQGLVMGNIVVRADGTHDPLDWHSDHRFEQRAMNFIVGGAAVALSTTAEVELGRRSTLPILAQIKGRPGASRVIEAMGRMSRLNDAQVRELLNWFGRIRNAAAEASSGALRSSRTKPR
jgi:hypothetical protein